MCPGSVGTRQALLQGWLLCVGFVCLANVPDLVALAIRDFATAVMVQLMALCVIRFALPINLSK